MSETSERVLFSSLNSVHSIVLSPLPRLLRHFGIIIITIATARYVCNKLNDKYYNNRFR